MTVSLRKIYITQNNVFTTNFSQCLQNQNLSATAGNISNGFYAYFKNKGFSSGWLKMAD